jgi:hypothetical protein
MVDSHIFMSYSRREYHFTESLTLYLQRAGIDIWFDNQQIKPGEDWHADIQAGLEGSNALILVASKASLASPYVREECIHALKAHKPVYVVVFETIKIPPALKGAAVIDFRTDFDKSVKALLQCLQQGKVRRDLIKSSDSKWLLQGIPGGVQEVEWTLLLNLLMWGIIVSYYLFFARWQSSNETRVSQDGPCLSLFSFILIILGWRIVYLWYSFMRREFLAQRIKRTLIYVFLAQLLTSLRIFFTLEFKPIELLILSVCMLSGYLLYRFWYNFDYLRWCPLGDDLTNMRMQMNYSLLTPLADAIPSLPIKMAKQVTEAQKVRTYPEPTLMEVADKTYRFHYFRGDEALATEVRGAISKVGYNEASAGEPDYHILLLNPWTPPSMLDEAIGLPNLICVLASSVEESDQVKKLKSSQWVDYRARSEQTLRNAFWIMNAPNSKDRVLSSLNIQPPQLRVYTFPPELKPIYRWTRWIAAWTLGVAISNFYRLANSNNRAELVVVVLNLLMVVYGIYLFRLADEIVTLKPPPLNLKALGLLPLGIIIFQIITLNMFYWQNDVVMNGALISSFRLFLGTFPQIVFTLALGRKFWIVVRELEKKGILATASDIAPRFHTSWIQSIGRVMGCLVIYSVLVALLPFFSSPEVVIVALGVLFMIYTHRHQLKAVRMPRLWINPIEVSKG